MAEEVAKNDPKFRLAQNPNQSSVVVGFAVLCLRIQNRNSHIVASRINQKTRGLGPMDKGPGAGTTDKDPVPGNDEQGPRAQDQSTRAQGPGLMGKGPGAMDKDPGLWDQWIKAPSCTRSQYLKLTYREIGFFTTFMIQGGHCHSSLRHRDSVAVAQRRRLCATETISQRDPPRSYLFKKTLILDSKTFFG